MDATNRVVAGWVLEERLGSGGFGEVWKARRRHAGLLRALKLVPISSEAAFASWRHEIGRLEELSHPHVVRFYDADIVGDDGPYRDCAWIATELCTRSLADELRRRPGHVLTAAECADLLEAMLGALAAAHAGGCVHRDVKPANILVHPSGAWKLCDFGTARLIPQGEAHPRTGIVGTFPYMSPAAHRGRQDQAADLYALGVTIHEALTGERLHPRAEGMTDSEYVKLVLDTPPRISPRLGPGWRTVVEALIGTHAPHGAGDLLVWFRETGGAVPPPPAVPTSGAGPFPAAGPVPTRSEPVVDTAELRPPSTRKLPRSRVEPPSGGWERERRARRRRRSGGQHILALLLLIVGSLAVAGALLYALIPDPIVIGAIVGTVLVLLVLVMALS